MDPQIVTYDTFVDRMEDGAISSVKIYDHGEVDLTFEAVSGEVFLVKTSYGSSRDSVLHYTLKKEDIPYTILGTPYGSDSRFEYLHITSLIMFLVPLIMICVIWKQAQTIRILSLRIADYRGQVN